jgi:hypothetical protein
MASNGLRDLVAIVGIGPSFMVMRHHADAQTPLRRRRTCRMLAAALGALLLEWTAPARAQDPAAPAPPPAAHYPGVPLSPTLPYWPEPPEHLLTPNQPLPPGDPPLLRRVVPGLDEGIAKLPPFLHDTALSFHLRTFYFNRLNPDGTQNEAWAFGGWLPYESGWLWDTFAIGAAGYTSQPPYAPDDTPGTLLLKPPQDLIFALGQLYGQLRYKEYALVTGYRQLVDDGYVNPNDSRMIPNTFEAATLTGRLGLVGYNVGYLTAMKPRQEDDFQNMAEVAGVQGRNRGLVLTRLSSDPLPGLSLYAANYLVPDVFNTAYGNADHTHAITDDLSFRIGIQYTDQRSTGSEFLGDFQTWNFGIRELLLWRGLTTGTAFNVTGDDASIRTPYGSWPGYLAFMETDFNRADEKAWGVGVRYNFGPGTRLPGLQIPRLSVSLRYAEGHDRVDLSTNSGLPTTREGNFDVIWNIPWVNGFQFRFRNAYTDRGTGRLHQAYRIIVNYDISLL